MIYNNREYPHPVLGIGIGDDASVGGLFNVHLSIKAGRETIRIEPVFKMDNKYINNLINEGKATFATQIYCRATMFRELRKSQNTIPETIVIPTPKLREEVEIDFFVCANEHLPDYTNSQSHSDYSSFTFNIEKGEILAYGGKGVFNANKTPEELKAVSAFMNIDKDNKENGPIHNFYDGPKITILLSENDYLKYQDIKINEFAIQVLHSGVVLPALMEAVEKVLDQDDEFADKRWYQIVEKLIQEKGDAGTLITSQRILDNPVNRSFNTIEKLLHYGD